MRVLMFSWEYPPHVVGGLGKHVEELIPALLKKGVEVDLITPRFEGQTEVQESGRLRVHRVYVQRPPDFDFYGGVARANINLAAHARFIAQQNGFDMIHAHDWLVSFAAVEIKHERRWPLLATIHATERGRGRGSLNGDGSTRINAAEWWLTYEAWRVIVCSEYMVEQVRDYFNLPLDKVDVVPNGVDPTPFDRLRVQDLSAFRRRFVRREEELIFSVGRIVHEKGFDTLVEAMPQVLSQVPEAHLVVAGKGALLDTLRQRAMNLGISDKVTFTGFISDEDRDRLYLVADVAVFPSLYEPFGIVALEAMAAGCPVVVSEVGGLKDVVQHGETGITVYPGDPHSVAWGIVHTLQHPDWARQRAAKAEQRARTVYSWDRIADQTIDIYQRIVTERAQTAW